jgi:hypothetical protein
MGIASVRLASALCAFLFAALTSGATAPSGSTTTDAHPVGEPVTTIIEFGDQYLGSELYDAKITVLQVVRGEKAWDRVRQASASNLPAKPGLEYLLARVRVEFWARTSPAHCSYNLNETQFTATAPDGRQFDSPILAVSPKPSLSGTLKPGDSLEGWLVFLVSQKVSRPVMVFREDVGIVSHTGGGTWFELYTRSISGVQPKP